MSTSRPRTALPPLRTWRLLTQSNTLHFAAGQASQTISIVVNGDTKVEPNETYNVTLSGATNGATISHTTGVGTIVNDDVAPPPPVPTVSIADASVTEGNNGPVTENFVVTRAAGSGNGAFDVNFATSDGTATVKDGDYNAQSNTLHFAAGVNSQTISVVVNGDTKVEQNETWQRLRSPVAPTALPIHACPGHRHHRQ